MPTQIDFRSFDGFRATTRAALENAALDDGQLETLRETVARDDISIHSINTSNLSEAEKGLAALLMLLRDTPGDAKLARISANLAEFFDRVVADKESSFQRSLRTDALGANPFEGWGPLRMRAFDQGTFQLADGESAIAIRAGETGEIDVSEAQSWTPDGLKTALDQLAAASAPSSDPLMQRFKQQLDQIEANLLQRAHAALNQVREEKLGRLEVGARALESALAEPKAPEYQVPQANIDAIGHALATAHDNPAAADVPQVFAVPLAQLKSEIAASLANLSEADSRGLVAAMERLGQIEGAEVTLEVARRAGISNDALGLLTLFRAVESSLAIPGVHETIRNEGSIREAARELLAGTSLDAALEKLQAEINEPDPFALYRGRALLAADPHAFTRETPILGVHAVEAEGAISGYQIVTAAGTWTLGPAGVSGPDHAAGEASPITDYSIDALRTLTSVLLTASPDAVSGPLSYFRKSEERTHGGFSYAELLTNLSAALVDEVTQRIAAIDRVVGAVSQLQSRGKKKREAA